MTYEYLNNSAIVEVRNYLIDEIHKTDILLDETYPNSFGGKIPVVPIQQLPETNDNLAGEPFIVYDIMPMPNNDDTFWIKCEEVTFYIYGSNYAKIIAIQDFLVDLFGRLDHTARNINDFSDSAISFLTCFLSGNNTVSPKKSEGGKYGATVSIEYDYTKYIDNDGRYSVYTPPSSASVTISGASSDEIITVDDTSYRVVTWLSSGSIEVVGSLDVEYLVVGGGGGASRAGGGGGGLLSNISGAALRLANTTETITVGAGGAGSSTVGSNGSDSSIGSVVVAFGGGGGGAVNGNGADGGCGGGASATTGAALSGGAGSQGGDGGGTSFGDPRYPAAGGGGAGNDGHDVVDGFTAGDGGAGAANTITGASVYYAGGGGGGVSNYSGGTPGNGGLGGGGAGVSASSLTNGNPGTDGLGGGGGGGNAAAVGGAGGDGVVILRWVV